MNKSAILGLLKDHLATGEDWARMPVPTLPGVFVRKMPVRKGRPAVLAIEINPVDVFGVPTKRSGLYLRDPSQIEALRTIFSSEKIETLLGYVDETNPTDVVAKPAGPVIEI